MNRIVVVGLGVLSGCGGGGADLEVSDGAVPGVAEVHFTSKKEGIARVYYSVSGGPEQQTPPSASGTEHDVTLLGLKAGMTYTVRVEVEGANGKITSSDEIEFTAGPPSQGMPIFSLEESEPELMCDPGGYFLFGFIGDAASGVGILDRDSQYVWTVPNEEPGAQVGRPRPGRDGKSILWNYADSERIEDLAAVVRLSMDGKTRTVTRTLNGHHDFVELPDGKIAWLGYAFDEAHEFELDGMMVTAPVAVDTIHEVEEGTSDAAAASTVFNMFEDYPHPVYNTGNNFRESGFLPGYREFSHGNSIAYLEHDDSYLIMLRWISALVKVDRATGAFVWQMGGVQNEFDDTDNPGSDENLFFEPHFSDAWSDQLFVFNNGPKPTPNNPSTSRLMRYTLDEDGRTFTNTWSYDTGDYENILGDVRRMGIEGCDNVLVSFSGQGRIAELTPDGRVAWSTAGSLGYVTTRVYYLPDLYDFTGAGYPQ